VAPGESRDRPPRSELCFNEMVKLRSREGGLQEAHFGGLHCSHTWLDTAAVAAVGDDNYQASLNDFPSPSSCLAERMVVLPTFPSFELFAQDSSDF